MSAVRDKFESLLGVSEKLQPGGEILSQVIIKRKEAEKVKLEAEVTELVNKAFDLSDTLERKKKEFEKVIATSEKELEKVLNKIQSIANGTKDKETNDDKEV